MSQLGPYEVLRSFEGAVSEAHLARRGDGNQHRQFVLVPLVLTPEDALAVRDELARCQRLKQPAITSVVELFEHQGRLILVFANNPGTNLRRLWYSLQQEKQRLSDAAALHIGYVLFAALAAAHDATDRRNVRSPIVHGQLGPHRVFISWGGAVSVLGFGLSRLFRPTSTHRPLPGDVLPFLPPESRDGGELTPATNVYSAAATMWSLLVRQLPGVGSGRLPPVGKLRPDLPPDVIAALDAALEPAAAQRSISSRELAIAFAQSRDSSGRRELGWTMAEHRRLAHFDPGFIPPESLPPRQPAALEPEKKPQQTADPPRVSDTLRGSGQRREQRSERRVKPRRSTTTDRPGVGDTLRGSGQSRAERAERFAKPEPEPEPEPKPKPIRRHPSRPHRRKRGATMPSVRAARLEKELEQARASLEAADRAADQAREDRRRPTPPAGTAAQKGAQPGHAAARRSERAPRRSLAAPPASTPLPLELPVEPTPPPSDPLPLDWEQRPAPPSPEPPPLDGAGEPAPTSPGRAGPTAEAEPADDEPIELRGALVSSVRPGLPEAVEPAEPVDDSTLAPAGPAELHSGQDSADEHPAPTSAEPPDAPALPAALPAEPPAAAHQPSPSDPAPAPSAPKPASSTPKPPKADERAQDDEPPPSVEPPRTRRRRRPRLTWKWIVGSAAVALVAFTAGYIASVGPVSVHFGAPGLDGGAEPNPPPPSSAARAAPTASGGRSSSSARPPASAPASSTPPPVATAAPTSDVDGASLPHDQGYLLVHCPSKELHVYANGRRVGITGAKVAVTCGMRHIRLGDRPLERWFSEGRAIDIDCRALTEVTIEPTVGMPVGSQSWLPP